MNITITPFTTDAVIDCGAFTYTLLDLTGQPLALSYINIVDTTVIQVFT